MASAIAIHVATLAGITDAVTITIGIVASIIEARAGVNVVTEAVTIGVPRRNPPCEARTNPE